MIGFFHEIFAVSIMQIPKKSSLCMNKKKKLNNRFILNLLYFLLEVYLGFE